MSKPNPNGILSHENKAANHFEALSSTIAVELTLVLKVHDISKDMCKT